MGNSFPGRIITVSHWFKSQSSLIS